MLVVGVIRQKKIGKQCGHFFKRLNPTQDFKDYKLMVLTGKREKSNDGH